MASRYLAASVCFSVLVLLLTLDRTGADPVAPVPIPGHPGALPGQPAVGGLLAGQTHDLDARKFNLECTLRCGVYNGCLAVGAAKNGANSGCVQPDGCNCGKFDFGR